MSSMAVLATCNLNQWAMDFHGNLQRIIHSIEVARSKGARYRLGPELEISGYGCEDHFLELDTFTHSWECIAELIQGKYSQNMLLDIGAPIFHHDVAYNCRLLILNREILLIRPKAYLADSGNYREPRWFRAWPLSRPPEVFRLPQCIRDVVEGNKEGTCVIGHAFVELDDGTAVACETCEELWTPRSPHIDMSLAGAHIIGNGSASHHVLRKLDERLDLIQSATKKGGGVYVYANQRGCDGGRLYYDGSALIALNGQVLTLAPQFSVKSEVDVVTAIVDLQDVGTYRAKHASRGEQAAASQTAYQWLRIKPTVKRFGDSFSLNRRSVVKEDWLRPTRPMAENGEGVKTCRFEEEIAKGPACWLWDFLRRSGLNGYFIALSGGADSAATATIVASMCDMVVKAASSAVPDGQTNKLDHEMYKLLLDDIRRVTSTGEGYIPKDAKELANRILHTSYMPCGDASSRDTRARASSVAKDIGSFHSVVDITIIVDAVISAFVSAFGGAIGGGCKRPKFRTRGGTLTENLALQNVQARIRMVVAYVFAQLSLWGRGRRGALLVLGSSNVDECLRGYLTKFDCSAADLNPIGGISKKDLKSFLMWASEGELGLSSLKKVIAAKPTAELEPIEKGYVQTDEEDMGMSYDDLTWYGRLRKLNQCGPLSMFRKLISIWHDTDLDVREIAKRVKFFFKMYSINRHKVTTLTPSYHAEDYSPEDNRFDLRQFLYNTKWRWQFDRIDEEVEQAEEQGKETLLYAA